MTLLLNISLAQNNNYNKADFSFSSKVVLEAFGKVDVKGVSIQADGFWRAENSGTFLDLK